MKKKGVLLFQNVRIEPSLLGQDLRLCKLAASHRHGKIICIPNHELTYKVHTMTTGPVTDGNKSIMTTIQVNYTRTSLVENVLKDPKLERETSDNWKSTLTPNWLDRKEYYLVMGDLIQDMDAYHIANHLTCAILDRGECLRDKITTSTEVEIANIKDINKDLAVCAHCDLHTIRKLKKCECRMGFLYCSQACQAAHWHKAHKHFHRIMEFISS